jgi:hypothetical protein
MFEVGDVVRLSAGSEWNGYRIGTEPDVKAKAGDIGIVIPNGEEVDEEGCYTVSWMRSGQITWRWYPDELEKIDDPDV